MLEEGGAIARQLGTQTALAEDPSSPPSIHDERLSHTQLQFQEIRHSLLDASGTYTDVYTCILSYTHLTTKINL